MRACAELVAGLAGDDTRAMEHLEAALAGFGAAGLLFEEARTRLALARRLSAEKPDVAIAEARTALTVFDRLGAVRAADAATAENIYAQLGVEPAQVCGSSSPGGLTKRELEILRRVAGGATNKQVAEQICISEKTVGRHLANIYAKLGVSSRTAAVAWAHDNNVLQ